LPSTTSLGAASGSPHRTPARIAKRPFWRGACSADQAGEPKVACPLHKKTFSLTTGKGLSDPAYAVATFPVRIQGDETHVKRPCRCRSERPLWGIEPLLLLKGRVNDPTRQAPGNHRRSAARFEDVYDLIASWHVGLDPHGVQ
jgi:hypothetical protein